KNLKVLEKSWNHLKNKLDFNNVQLKELYENIEDALKLRKLKFEMEERKKQIIGKIVRTLDQIENKINDDKLNWNNFKFLVHRWNFLKKKLNLNIPEVKELYENIEADLKSKRIQFETQKQKLAHEKYSNINQFNGKDGN